MMKWSIAVLVAGVVFGASTAPAMRRWGPRGLWIVAIVIAVIAEGACVAWTLMGARPDEAELWRRVLSAAVVGATIAGALTVRRLVTKASVPDILAEICFGAVAFAGGAVAGTLLGIQTMAGVVIG